ncbi:MAG: carbon-nitrogen hydrolase family protein, partial [Bryobacteraceae bacterium]
EKYARQAATAGAKLVVTPESFLDGYVGNDKQNRPFASREKYFSAGETLQGRLLARVGNLARELGIYLLVGFPERVGEQMYNSIVIFSPAGKIIHHYSKTHCGGDEPYNTEGTAFPVVDTPLGRWGTLICLDRQFPEPARILAIKGAQLILFPSYGGYGEMNDAMMRTRACENGVYAAFVHPRSCLIINPRGRIIARDHGQGDEVVMATIQLKDAGRGAIRYRRPEIYKEILLPNRNESR